MVQSWKLHCGMCYGQEVEMYDESYMPTGMEFIWKKRFPTSTSGTEIDASDPNKVEAFTDGFNITIRASNLFGSFDEDSAFFWSVMKRSNRFQRRIGVF